MNATLPGANSEYSRGSQRSRRAHDPRAGGRPGRRGPAGGTVGAAVLAGGLLGALLLLIAEFTTLFQVRTADGTVVQSVGTGSHQSYALVPIAVLVGLLAYAVRSAGSRPALLAIGVMGVAALLIALLGDLPDAHASGVVGRVPAQFAAASSRPSAGLYMETLGAAVLVITCVCGFLMIGPPPPAGVRRRQPARGAGADGTAAAANGRPRPSSSDATVRAQDLSAS